MKKPLEGACQLCHFIRPLAMNEIIIASVVLLVVVVGAYVLRAEKVRRRSHEQTRNPWDNVRTG